MSGQPGDTRVVVESLTEGPQLCDVEARRRGEEVPVELVLVVPRGPGLRPTSCGVAVLGRDAGGGSPHRHIAEQSVWECRVAGCPAWGRGLQRVEAYLVGEVGHVLGACCEVGTPACVVGYGGWDAGGRRWGRG